MAVGHPLDGCLIFFPFAVKEDNRVPRLQAEDSGEVPNLRRIVKDRFRPVNIPLGDFEPSYFHFFDSRRNNQSMLTPKTKSLLPSLY
jgi:hypothetical protein